MQARVHSGNRRRSGVRLAAAALVACLAALLLPLPAGAQSPGALDEYQPPPPGVNLDPSAFGNGDPGTGGSTAGTPGTGATPATDGSGSRPGSKKDGKRGKGDDRVAPGTDVETQSYGPTLPVADYPVTSPILILVWLAIGLIVLRLGLAGYRRLQNGR